MSLKHITWEELKGYIDAGYTDPGSRIVVMDWNTGEERFCDLVWIDSEVDGFQRPALTINFEEDVEKGDT